MLFMHFIYLSWEILFKLFIFGILCGYTVWIITLTTLWLYACKNLSNKSVHYNFPTAQKADENFLNLKFSV